MIESTDPDLRLMLSNAEPLLMSRNPSVRTVISSSRTTLTLLTGDLSSCTSLLLCWATIREDAYCVAAVKATSHFPRS
jgi:hypothetical protein